MDSPPPDRTRAWLRMRNIAIVGFLAGWVVAAVLGAPSLQTVVVMAVYLTMAAWLVSPSRSWWGPGPSAWRAAHPQPSWFSRWGKATVILLVVAVIAWLAIVAFILVVRP